MFVKICGITRLEDAVTATDLGARALGFNFYQPSKRYIEPERAAEIIRELPGHVLTAGVFVNSPAEEVEQISSECDLDLIQLHGDESPEFCREWSERLIRAIRLSSEAELQNIADYSFARMILVDAAVKGAYGGTGTVADWQLAVSAKEFGLPVLLAGGLTPANVGAAITAVNPFGVDVAGGVESAPGIKDPEKIRQFMRAVRSAFRRKKVES
jgi:phosphoribosylanthranilate isomerase